MADKRKGSGSDTPRRARSAPTIDLTATEVSEPVSDTPAQEPSAGESEPAFAAASEGASAAEPSSSEATPQPETEQSQPDAPASAEPPPARRPGLALPFAAGIVGG